ncbi:MAG: hypothetical protein IKT44_00910 [Clostridia bacterium]|nr:hypothetical protein [Clostridia bacterium]
MKNTAKKTSTAQIEAINRYNAKNTTATIIRLNNKTDAELIEFLENCGNKQGTIKAALRLYMQDIKYPF